MSIKVESFLAIEKTLANRLQAEFSKEAKPLFQKIDDAIEAGDFDEAERVLNTLTLHSAVERTRPFMEYMTHVAMLFGASRVTSTPGTSVVGLGYEKTTAFQMVQTLQQMLTIKAEVYLRQQGMQLIALYREKAQVVQKANPYHDADGKFTTKEKSASGTPDAYKIYAKTVSSVAGWEKGSDYNGEVRLVPLSKIDTQPDEVWSEEYRRGSGQKTIDYLKKEAFGTVYEGGRTVGSNKLEALLVRSTDSGRYQLVDGQHRYNLLKQIGSSVAGVQVIGAVQKSNPYHDAEGKFTTKDKDADHYSALREFTKAEIALLKGVKISTGSKLAEAMDNATEGHVDVQAIKATLAKGGKNYAQVEIPLSHLDWGSVTDEVAAVRADPNKGAILVGANGEIVDGRHRSLLAKQSGDKTIRAWVPVADALNILSKVQKAERILRPFESFVDEAGQAYFNMVSSLHTSRVSAYGFTAEAFALGLEEYQVNEVLDARTCKVCAAMHGKTFKVSDARRLLNIVTRVTDPDDLKVLQPWPPQSKDGVVALRNMTNDELAAKGWHTPPFHPGCRGLLGRAGMVPTIEQITDGFIPAKYIASEEDFNVLGQTVTEDQVKVWNSTIGLAPSFVVSTLQGKKEDLMLAGLLKATNVEEYLGLKDMIVANDLSERTMVAIEKRMFGSKSPVALDIEFHAAAKTLYIDNLVMDAEDKLSHVGKKILRSAYILSKDAEMDTLGIRAKASSAGVDWIEAGFSPTNEAWEGLTQALLSDQKLATYISTLPESESALLRALLKSGDPKSLTALADIPEVTDALLGFSWPWNISLSDKAAVTKLLAYLDVETVKKANPYHDEGGRFTSKDKDASEHSNPITPGEALDQLTGTYNMSDKKDRIELARDVALILGVGEAKNLLFKVSAQEPTFEINGKHYHYAGLYKLAEGHKKARMTIYPVDEDPMEIADSIAHELSHHKFNDTGIGSDMVSKLSEDDIKEMSKTGRDVSVYASDWWETYDSGGGKANLFDAVDETLAEIHAMSRFERDSLPQVWKKAFVELNQRYQESLA